MSRRGCVATWLVVFVFSGVALARASPSPEEGPTTADSPFLLSRAIERQAHRLSQIERANAGHPWDLGQGSTRTRLRRCHSKKKGVLVGAAIGAAAAGAFAVYVAREVSGEVFGAAQGAPRLIAYFTVGGAGAGALGGLLYCR